MMEAAGDDAAIGGDDRAGDVAREIGRKESNDGADLVDALRLAERPGLAALDPTALIAIVAARVALRLLDRALGLDRARIDADDAQVEIGADATQGARHRHQRGIRHRAG